LHLRFGRRQSEDAEERNWPEFFVCKEMVR
jgi:hypothetical protein